MQSRGGQRGMTFWSLLFVAFVLGFFTLLIFKLFPPYMEDFKVRSALDSLVRQGDVSGLSRTDIAVALSKRFEIDNIDSVKLDKDLTVENRGRMKVVRIRYDSVIPMLGNLSILLEFDHTKEVKSSAE